MRIAMFTEVFLPKIDGVVTRVLRTLDELSAMGHDVLVFAPGSPPPVYAGFDIVKVRSVGFRPWYPEIKVGLPTPKIAEQMIAFRPEVVHAVNPAWLAAYGVLSAKRRDIPLLASYHTQLASYTKDLHLSWLAGTADRWTTTLHNRAEVNLCTSPQMVAAAIAGGVTDVDLWPKAVDTVTYHPGARTKRMRRRLTDSHPDMPLAIYVGRLSNERIWTICCRWYTKCRMSGSLSWGPDRPESPWKAHSLVQIRSSPAICAAMNWPRPMPAPTSSVSRRRPRRSVWQGWRRWPPAYR